LCGARAIDILRNVSNAEIENTPALTVIVDNDGKIGLITQGLYWATGQRSCCSQ
jgi:hypothetical protein